MSTLLGTTALDFQNFYQSALTSDITDVATDIFIDTVPSVSEGILVIDPDSSANREIIYYSSKTGTKVVCPATGRGYDSSTAAAHSGGTKVIMAPVADWFNMLRTGQLGSADMRGGWLGAAETWTYASFASTVGTITVPSDATTKYSAGMKIRISQSTGGTKYGIITKVASTLLTVYFGTDYTLNNEAISSPCYSTQKAPQGFPIDPAKWTISTSYTALTTQNPATVGTVYNPGSKSITLPIGAWITSIQGSVSQDSSSSSGQFVTAGLSTSASSFSDNELIRGVYIRTATTSINYAAIFVQKTVTTTSSTPYYAVVSATSGSGTVSTGFSGGSTVGDTVIRAICAYL